MDTLEASRFTNINELWVQFRGDPWRILFAFDPKRAAILLVGGKKRGDNRWCKKHLPIADERFEQHLRRLDEEKSGGDPMLIKFEEFLAGLPEERQQAIEKRAAELIAEEATLRQVREAREQSQEEVAKKLRIKQAAVSRLERRTDMYLSTLRGFIEAMGGTLEIVARFPDRAVRITQFEDLDPESRMPR